MRTKPDLAEEKKSIMTNLGCSLLRWLGLGSPHYRALAHPIASVDLVRGVVLVSFCSGFLWSKTEGWGLRGVAMPVAASINPTAEPNFSPSVLERLPAFRLVLKALRVDAGECYTS